MFNWFVLFELKVLSHPTILGFMSSSLPKWCTWVGVTYEGVIGDAFCQNTSPMTTHWRRGNLRLQCPHISDTINFFRLQWALSHISNKGLWHSETRPQSMSARCSAAPRRCLCSVLQVLGDAVFVFAGGEKLHALSSPGTAEKLWLADLTYLLHLN